MLYFLFYMPRFLRGIHDCTFSINRVDKPAYILYTCQARFRCLNTGYLNVFLIITLYTSHINFI
ncbi:protein of unknown function [Legionella fallonii LLAP-10]|uniref:Uncharacterized protein n=1 Tax=Legionella fallonii LLAP-10 TaxID=1212491 RepID=A0A098G5C3_9GAMM|nr:protein of unknown function [Legionella fallonii LLAP-10]